MNVSFTTYPVQEWILDEESGNLAESKFDIQAIAQDIKFALSTERSKYPIMGSNFGVMFEDLIGLDSEYVCAQIKKRISDALSIDDRIVGVGHFEFKHSKSDELRVSFIVETVLGKLDMTTDIVGA
jgi:hypothetical protein